MVRPQQLVDAVLYTLQSSADIPSAANYVGYEPDINSESIKLPLIEVSTGVMVNADRSNTELVGDKTDDSGNVVGKIYTTLYTLELNIAVWTAHGSKWSPRDIGDEVRDELYKRTTSGIGLPLVDPEDDDPLDEVWRVRMDEASQTDDLNTSPTLRRWRQTITVSASEQYITEPEQPPLSGFNLNA
jgi:hypothetical protein